MGGNLFKKDTIKRYNKEEYENLIKLVKEKLSKYFDKFTETISLPSKNDYGDLDMVYTLRNGEQINWNQIKNDLEYTEIHHNGPYTSILYKDEFQIDFNHAKNFEFMHFITSYSGIFHLIGWSIKKQNIKFSDDGIYYVFSNIKVLLSSDVTKIFEFLCLNYERFIKGFQTETELFEYVYNCKYFIMLENKSSRVEKNCNRPIFLKFFEYIKTKDDFRENYLDNLTQNYILKFFDKELQFNKIISDMKKSAEIRKYYNGEYIGNFSYKKGRDLGNLMIKIKENSDFESIFLSQNIDKINSLILKSM